MSDLIINHCFQSISYEIQFSNDKGKMFYESDHVRNVEEIKGINGWSYIKGMVIRQTSVNLETWKVNLEVNIIFFI